MVIGRTEEGLIKIKTDDPLGLRAVNCACCCSFTKISTELADIIKGKTTVKATFNFPAFVYEGSPISATIGNTGFLSWDGASVFWEDPFSIKYPDFFLSLSGGNCLLFILNERGNAYRTVSSGLTRSPSQSINVPINGINVSSLQTNDSAVFGIPLSACPTPTITITFS